MTNSIILLADYQVLISNSEFELQKGGPQKRWMDLMWSRNMTVAEAYSLYYWRRKRINVEIRDDERAELTWMKLNQTTTLYSHMQPSSVQPCTAKYCYELSRFGSSKPYEQTNGEGYPNTWLREIDVRKESDGGRLKSPRVMDISCL